MEEQLQKITTVSDQILNPVPSDPQTVAEYELTLLSLKASINEIIPEVNYLYNYELAKQTEDLLKEYPEIASNSSAWKNLLKGKMATYQKVIDITDRTRSTIESHLRGVISYLSYIKSTN